MTDQHPQPALPDFTPVPAVPIVVLAHCKDACHVRTADGVSSGPTLREAVKEAHGINEQS